LKTKTIPTRLPEKSFWVGIALPFSFVPGGGDGKESGWIYRRIGAHISSTVLRSARKMKTELCPRSTPPTCTTHNMILFKHIHVVPVCLIPPDVPPIASASIIKTEVNHRVRIQRYQIKPS